MRAVYEATRSLPAEEEFVLTRQIRRSAISIPSNIAEGRGRDSKKDYRHFLIMARGSLFELETQLVIARELGYAESINDLLTETAEIGMMINSLLRWIDQR